VYLSAAWLQHFELPADAPKLSVNSYIYSVTIIESRKNEGMDEFLKIQDSQGLYVYLSINKKKKILLLKKRERNSAGEWLLCANSDKLYICTVCACQKKKIQI